MKTSFEFEYEGRKVKAEYELTGKLYKVKAEYEQTEKLNMGDFKLFSFRVLEGGDWVYQGTLSFPVKFTKKQIIENVRHIF